MRAIHKFNANLGYKVRLYLNRKAVLTETEESCQQLRDRLTWTAQRNLSAALIGGSVCLPACPSALPSAHIHLGKEGPMNLVSFRGFLELLSC